MRDLSRLKEAAIKALPATGMECIELHHFLDECSPDLILEMIAEIERLDVIVDDLENHILEMGERD